VLPTAITHDLNPSTNLFNPPFKDRWRSTRATN